MKRQNVALMALLIAAVGAAGVAYAQVEVEITSQEVVPGIYMLQGQGGNMGLAVGPDATILIDDQFAPLTDKIVAAAAAVSERPIDFLINTHWHGDHTGGNENLGEQGAWIVAHENVRVRMSSPQFVEMFNMRSGAAPEVAKPSVTFDDSITLHLNGDSIQVVHVPRGHTDSDSIVYFETADVLHMGDTYFAGTFPFIDVPNMGTLAGAVKAVAKALELTGPDTRVIPGHGPLSNRTELEAYRDMLAGVHAAVSQLVSAGKTRDEVIAAGPTAAWDEAFGGGFFTPEIFAGLAYDSVVAEAATQ